MTHSVALAPSRDNDLVKLRPALIEAGFAGDIENDKALLAAMSTDNSIYTLMPDLVVAPRDSRDVKRLMEVLGHEAFRSIPVTARGGGTGTNGQSLNSGVIVDFQRYMNRLVALNVDERWVEVEPGIVLDELNAALSATGLFFAPTTSTANRCTIGGMVSTDASGKGSRIYGKTSDNVLGMEIVLDGGRTLDSSLPCPDWAKSMMADVEAACEGGRAVLLSRVPSISRRFTGYDLERAKQPDRPLEWWRLPIGAEGTLGLITRVRVRLLRKPDHKRLVIVGFESFATALGAGRRLMEHDPSAIEVMNEWVQMLAEKAGILSTLPASLRALDGKPIAYNFVEFVGDDEVELETRVAALQSSALHLPGVVAVHYAENNLEMSKLWTVRAASVGLLGKVPGTRRPIAFVEDCVVPVDNLSAFVDDFMALLKHHGLAYGMYGHVDVGCLHIRPALDIDQIADQKIMKTVSDKVFELTRKHGGIFWGEHGKGVRGAYLAEYVGETAYDAFRSIKKAFDPADRFNPGKLVTVRRSLMGIATTPFRRVNIDEGDAFHLAFKCNGNAQCLSYPRSTVMCPSFKATRDPRHSPKGRADALRTWHQAETEGKATPELEANVMSALDGCLGCKACATACPVQVDIPEMKSHFLERIYRKRRRGVSDRLALILEEHAPLLVSWRKSLALLSRLTNRWVGKLTGLVDLPPISYKGLADSGYQILSPTEIANRAWSDETVFIWQDPFTTLFDIEAPLAIADGLRALGYKPMFVALLPGGKAAHVLGDRQRFLMQAGVLRQAIDLIGSKGRPMVGVDPAFVMMLRQEYSKVRLHGKALLLVQEFLDNEAAARKIWPDLKNAKAPRQLFAHCSENAPGASSTAWKKVFATLGVEVEVAATGCCGMAGLFGHQKRNQAISRKAFDLSWSKPMQKEGSALVSGFSCRCQTKRFSGVTGIHPMRWIADAANALRNLSPDLPTEICAGPTSERERGSIQLDGERGLSR